MRADTCSTGTCVLEERDDPTLYADLRIVEDLLVASLRDTLDFGYVPQVRAKMNPMIL